jgi:hypothetical protein
MKRYQAREQLGLWGRLKVVLGRVFESHDDELAYAFYAANASDGTYQRRQFSKEYARCAYPLYQRTHVERGIAMALKACGLNATGRLSRWLTNAACGFLRYHSKRLNAAG